MPVERPASVPVTATFDPGGGQWRDRRTDGALAEERTWTRDGDLSGITTFEHGVRTGIRFFHRNGRVSHAYAYRDGVETSRHAWYEDGAPRSEVLFAPERRTSFYPDGTLQSQSADGTARTFLPSGALRSETTGARTTWFGEDGTVEATEDKHPRRTGVHRRREFGPDGRLLAEGDVDRAAWGGRGAAGVWRLFAADGTVRDEADFASLTFPPDTAVATTAETLLAWHAEPPAPWLANAGAGADVGAGARSVAWGRQKVWFGRGADLPLFLNGLASPRPDVFALALLSLRRALHHQGTLAPAGKAAAPFLVAAAAALDGPRRDQVVELLLAALTDNGYLGTAARTMRARASTPVGALRVQAGTRLERWRDLTAAGDVWAARLLPLAAGPAGGAVVLEAARSATDPAIRAELTLSLGLCRPAPPTTAWLHTHLPPAARHEVGHKAGQEAGQEAKDKARHEVGREADARQRCCAAVALAWLGNPLAVPVLVDAVVAAPPGCAELYWLSDGAQDARTALARLPEGLAALLAAFTNWAPAVAVPPPAERAAPAAGADGPSNSVGEPVGELVREPVCAGGPAVAADGGRGAAVVLAGALLEVAFRERAVRPTVEQVRVLRAIVDHPTVWGHPELVPLLRDWELPVDRAALAGAAAGSA